MALSDVSVRTAKPKDKPYKLSDEEGLFLYVTPNGSKFWRYKYRFFGKEKLLSLGQYPEVGLKAARAAKDEARAVLEQGFDPSSEKKRKTAEASIAAGTTFKLVADEYIDKLRDDGMAASTEKKTLWLLKQLEPQLGNRPVSEIEPIEILNILRHVERKGNNETTHRLRAFCSRVFKYAIWTARARTDPADLLTGALRTVKVKHHAAIVDPVGVGELLRALDAFEGFKPLRAALRLSPHVFVRPAELRKAAWPEFNFDEGYWRIPPERMKMRIEHFVPLSTQSISILLDLREITGGHHYLFPSIRTWQQPMSENAVNVSLRRLGFESNDMTGHGFRSTASTLLNESGLWQPDAIEVALAHKVDKNKVRSAYNRGQYWEERVRMMQWWSDYLDRLRDGNVQQLKRPA